MKKSGNPVMGESRIFMENKKLVSENFKLKSELASVTAILQLEQEERNLESVRQSQ